MRITIAAPAFSSNEGLAINILYTPARSQDRRLRSHCSRRSDEWFEWSYSTTDERTPDMVRRWEASIGASEA